uniref:Insulin-degrading enzyme n=1 Tax=Aplanochytrium stocchinoi TaxID=215587 RepID=A0A7S3PH67_9STRA|mmetsp:Transcript_21121/g.26966  ORF Transcript_21121/g.26966 Transcript_21121/m.26966 type:complete len:1132 (+) Transcript_21121:378-3773(+)|eukprot:CAMPEP_0204874316 /NCGR_PEP_ID=MMETSP1348-20121228/42710_1 /ASSEMBLY_ACC=CAM_ASM_000700 /TAXON_ID=215587 /ORGANISM="Aplanochytrium stocchinoi, Strain GSBS06" /LENGTH=1131 /DNA_ID=CAMNT_0052030043 /DNA_START=351 /DNA_END=3746 /DNA_ORIENTATION=+
MRGPNFNLGLNGFGRILRRGNSQQTADSHSNVVASSEQSGVDGVAKIIGGVDVASLVELAVVRENGIEKSALDPRRYSCLQLENGLQVLLICDPMLEKSAAALSVRVGNHSDPPEIPGLAHFLEHMLFLGTEKYPDEAEYSTFLSDHGGINNAFTSAEETNFHFDVMSDFFYEALDRFAQFFISPLFKMDTTNRELQAVDNEYSRSLQTDAQRLWHVFKLLSNDKHPFHQFGMGNSHTLKVIPQEHGIDVREALFDFHDRYYSANRMKLVLIGKDDLSTMEEYCYELFAQIPNKSSPNPYPYPNPHCVPFMDRHLGKRVNIVPVRDIRSINLLFPTLPIRYDHSCSLESNALPSEWNTHGASSYLSHLISREDPGSILSYLRKRQWANSLTASTSSAFSDFSVFSITVGCTDVGITDHVDDIVEVIFAYINLLGSSGPMKWYFDEISALAAIKFRFKSEEHPFTCATMRASKMHEYPIDKILSASWIETEFDHDSIERMTHALVPERCLLFVMHKSMQDCVTKEEPWYKAKYSVQNMNSMRWMYNEHDGLDHIKQAYENELKLPRPNEFIPENFDTYPFENPVPVDCNQDAQSNLDYHPRILQTLAAFNTTPSLETLSHAHIEDKRAVALAKIERNVHNRWEGKDDVWRPPTLIRVKKNSILWFKQDVTFKRPETTVRLLLKTCAFSDSALQHMRSLIYVNLVDDCLSESNYPAAVSGLNYTRGVDTAGLGITVLGYSDKIDKYFEFIVKSFRDTSKFEEAQFDRIKENLMKSLTNERKNSPLSHSQKLLYHLSQSSLWTPEEKIACLCDITLEDVISQEVVLFENVQLEMFVYGNATVNESFNLLDIAERIYGCNDAVTAEPSRAVNLETRKQYIYMEHCRDHENTNSAVILSFQIDTISPRLQGLAAILEQFTHELFFHQLRTNEQLGYVCYASQYSIHGVLNFKFCLQSNTKDPIYMNERIEKFIDSLGEKVDNLGEEQFENMIHSFINNTLQEKRNMQSEEGHWYSSIESGLYDFTFRIDTATAAAELTLDDFRDFYHRFFPWNAPLRKKIMVGAMCKAHALEVFGDDYDRIMEEYDMETRGFGDLLEVAIAPELAEQGDIVHLTEKKDIKKFVSYYPSPTELLELS